MGGAGGRWVCPGPLPGPKPVEVGPPDGALDPGLGWGDDGALGCAGEEGCEGADPG